MQIWIQIYVLSLHMYNTENAHRIGNKVGRCISVESENTMNQRSFLRLKIEIDAEKTLMARFWWSNSMRLEKWAMIKYERLSDFRYGYKMLGHTSQQCEEEVALSEMKPGFPRYGPWLFRTRPWTNNKWFQVLGGNKQTNIARDTNRRSWMDVMNERK